MTQSIAEAEAKPSAVSMLYHHLENPENVEALLDTDLSPHKYSGRDLSNSKRKMKRVPE